ncbi:MAG: signal peptidase II [Candidatus Gastranaerophilaceae bacterium]
MTRKKQSQSYSSKIAYLFLTFAVFVFANIYLSDFIIENYDSGLLFENPVLKLTYIKNSGAAFSILSQYPFAIIAISVTILVALFAFVIKHANTMSFYGIFWLDMIMSGIFCNLLQRIQFGYVVDYFDLKFINFPVFNLSDIAINIGILVVIISLLKKAQLSQL